MTLILLLRKFIDNFLMLTITKPKIHFLLLFFTLASSFTLSFTLAPGLLDAAAACLAGAAWPPGALPPYMSFSGLFLSRYAARNSIGFSGLSFDKAASPSRSIGTTV